MIETHASNVKFAPTFLKEGYDYCVTFHRGTVIRDGEFDPFIKDILDRSFKPEDYVKTIAAIRFKTKADAMAFFLATVGSNQA